MRPSEEKKFSNLTKTYMFIVLKAPGARLQPPFRGVWGYPRPAHSACAGWGAEPTSPVDMASGTSPTTAAGHGGEWWPPPRGFAGPFGPMPVRPPAPTSTMQVTFVRQSQLSKAPQPSPFALCRARGLLHRRRHNLAMAEHATASSGPPPPFNGLQNGLGEFPIPYPRHGSS